MVWFFDPRIDERHPAFVRGMLRCVRHKNSLHRFDRGGLTTAGPVSLPNGRIPLREPPCPGRQVGEGVSPTLDAQPLSNSRLRIGKSLAVWKLQYRCAGLSSCQFAACRLVQARETATGIIVIDIPAVLDRSDAIKNLPGLIEFKG